MEENIWDDEWDDDDGWEPPALPRRDSDPTIPKPIQPNCGGFYFDGPCPCGCNRDPFGGFGIQL